MNYLNLTKFSENTYSEIHTFEREIKKYIFELNKKFKTEIKTEYDIENIEYIFNENVNIIKKIEKLMLLYKRYCNLNVIRKPDGSQLRDKELINTQSEYLINEIKILFQTQLLYI